MAVNQSGRDRLVKAGSLGVGIALMVALFLIVNYFGWKYHARFDWTSSRLYSLSDKTLGVLAEIEGDVEIQVLVDPADELYTAVREMLTRYEAASPWIRVRMVDPVRDAVDARRLYDEYQRDVIVFQRGDDRRIVDPGDLAELDYSGMQFGEGPEMKEFRGETLFTSALLELVEGRKPKVAFSVGHGEPALDDFGGGGLSSARELLGEDNFALVEWASATDPVVPAGTDLVVVVGPQTKFLEPEAEALRSFAADGGRLLLLLEPFVSPAGGLAQTGLEDLVRELGAQVGQDVVFDPDGRVPLFGPGALLVTSFGGHVVTRTLDQAALSVLLPVARSITPIDDATSRLASETLLRTSERGWGETSLEDDAEFALDAADLAGPVSLGVALEGTFDLASAAAGGGEEPMVGEPASTSAAAGSGVSTDGAGETRVVVLGDADFASNSQLFNSANAMLLANTLNWLVERESLLAIPAKRPEQVRLNLTGDQARWVTVLVLVVMPLAALAAGVWVFSRRRR